MFCSSCGAQFTDDAKVCPVCGKVVESVSDDSQQMPTPSSMPPKKSRSKLPLIAIIAGALLVVVLLVVGFWSYLSNTVAKTFLPADKYYTYVEKSNVENTVSQFYDFFGLGSSDEIKEGYSGSMKVEIGKEMKELYEIAEMEEEMEWLENVEITFDANVQEQLSDMTLTGKMNGKDIIAGEMIMDMEEGDVYMTVPDLMEKYIKFPLSMANVGSSEDMDETREMMSKINDAIPSERIATKLTVRYFELIAGSIENAEKSSEKIEIKDVSQSCTVITVKIDGETVVNAMIAVLEEAKDDKEIKTIIRDMAKAVEEDPDDVYDTFKEGVEDALEALEDVDPDDIDDAMGDKIVMKVWVAANGEIVAREFEYNDAVIMMASIEQGSKVATEYSVEVNDVCVFELKGSGKKSLTGLITGKYDLSVSEQEVLKIEVEDYDADAWEKDGYLNGKFYFGFGKDVSPEDVMDGAPSELLSIVEDLRLGFEVKSNKKELSMATMILNKKDPYITLTLSAKQEKYAKPSVPSSGDTVDGEDQDELQELLEAFDLDKLISRLEKAGVPEDLLEGN